MLVKEIDYVNRICDLLKILIEQNQTMLDVQAKHFEYWKIVRDLDLEENAQRNAIYDANTAKARLYAIKRDKVSLLGTSKDVSDFFDSMEKQAND